MGTHLYEGDATDNKTWVSSDEESDGDENDQLRTKKSNFHIGLFVFLSLFAVSRKPIRDKR